MSRNRGRVRLPGDLVDELDRQAAACHVNRDTLASRLLETGLATLDELLRAPAPRIPDPVDPGSVELHRILVLLCGLFPPVDLPPTHRNLARRT